MSLLSVLTPTYNRRERLETLFQSLCRQTNQDFEWWIVDDGSTDGTRKTVESLCGRASFQIRYIYKENGGKHTALNAAIPQITSTLTIIVDSDDMLTDDAVETVFRYHGKYAGHGGLCGYVFHKQSPDGKISGKRFSPEERIGSYIDVRVNGNDTHADKAEVFYTRCLREFPFPEFPGERFLGEDVVWLQMGRTYPMVHINRAIYTFEYQNDGLTRNRRRNNIASPRGCVYRAELYMERDIRLRYRVKGALQYLIYGKFAGRSFFELWRKSRFRCLVAAVMLPAVPVWAMWKRMYQN